MAFQKGQSGNPGGRPKAEKEVIELARSHGVEAVKKLVDIMRTADDKTAKLAADSILDRGFGKPKQPLSGVGEGEEGDAPLGIVVHFVKPDGTSKG